MSAIVVVTPDELRELVRDAVRAELGERNASVSTHALVTKQALAAQLSISVAGVDRLVRDGRIPFVRVGDVKRFDVIAVRAALESAPSTSPAVEQGTVHLLRRGGA